jgi:hypothetical protein
MQARQPSRATKQCIAAQLELCRRRGNAVPRLIDNVLAQGKMTYPAPPPANEEEEEKPGDTYIGRVLLAI